MGVAGVRYKNWDEPWSTNDTVIVDLPRIWHTDNDYQKWFLYPELYAEGHRPLQLFLGGRGTGKTWVLVRKAILCALENPGCPILLLGRTGRELHDKIQPELDKALRDFLDATGISLARFSAAEQAYHVLNDATIYCRPYGRRHSLNLVAGYTAAAAIVDEEARAGVDGKTAFETIFPGLRHPRANRFTYAAATSPDGLKGFVQHVMEIQQREKRGLLGEGEKPTTWTVTASILDAKHLSPDYVAAMKATMSKAAWEQEGLGKLLKPQGLVYSAFDPEVHCIPTPEERAAGLAIGSRCPIPDWKWDPERPYILASDPGPNHAWFGVIQPDRKGRWVLAYEEKHEGSTEVQFRQAIKKTTDRIYKRTRQHPYFVVTDRSQKDMRAWLEHHYGDEAAEVTSCRTRAEYDIRRGIEMVQAMIDPVEGEPMFYLGPAISRHMEEKGRGAYGSLLTYRWQRNIDGSLSDKPHKGVGATDPHPLDAIRYAVVMSRFDRELHGGRIMNFDAYREDAFQPHDHRDGDYLHRAA